MNFQNLQAVIMEKILDSPFRKLFLKGTTINRLLNAIVLLGLFYVLPVHFIILWLLFAYCIQLCDIKNKKYRSPLIGYPIIGVLGGSIFIKENNTFQAAILAAKICRKRKGPGIRIMNTGLFFSYALVYEPEAAVKLLNSENINKSREYDFLHPWLGRGLLTAETPYWSPRRRLLTASFHKQLLDRFLPILWKNSQIMVKLIEESNNKPINIVDYSALCALDNISETIMGKEIKAQENSDSEYVHAVHETSTSIHKRQSLPWLYPDLCFYLSSEGRKFRRNVETLHKFSEKVIFDQREERNKKKFKVDENEETTKQKVCLLDLLLDYQETHSDLSDSEIREEVDTFMFAGHDTTAMAISWCLYLLGCHPEQQTLVQEELNNIFEDDTDRMPSNSDISQMQHLDLCIKETLRLYPSVPFLGRKITKDIEIEGQKLREGTHVMLLPYIIHRSLNHYKNPDVFDPHRFQKDSSNDKIGSIYIPFSVGQRNCIGQRFALLEAKVVLSTILRNFTVESVETRDQLNLRAHIVLKPANGLMMRMKPTRNIIKCDEEEIER